MNENNYYEGLMNRICVLHNVLAREEDLVRLDSRNRKRGVISRVYQMARGNELFEVSYKVVDCNGQKFWQFVGAK